MKILSRSLLILPSLLTLTACEHAYWPDAYTYPTGYSHHDITPISSPHGYAKTPLQEEAFKTGLITNAEAWRTGLTQILTPISSALDINQPVAVVMDPGLTPLNASAANYLRDLLVHMGYLTTLPGQTEQMLIVSAKPTSNPDHYDVTLGVEYQNVELIKKTDIIMIPGQVVEASRLPGFTRTPATGPSAAVPRPYQNLNSN